MARGVRGAGQYTIAVEGLDQLVRDFGRMSKDARKKLQAKLKDVAGIVRDESRKMAVARGLAPPGSSGRGRGKLYRSIRVFATGSTAGVRDSAQRGGYAYPIRYEYGGRGGGARGVRDFLAPGLEHKTDEVMRGLEDMLDDLARSGGFDLFGQ